VVGGVMIVDLVVILLTMVQCCVILLVKVLVRCLREMALPPLQRTELPCS